LDSPTVWSALAAINQKVEEVIAVTNKHRKPTLGSDPLLVSKVSRLEKDLLSTVTQLSHAISALSTRLDEKVSPAVKMDTSESLGAGFYADLQERMGKMTGQIENLKAEKQISAITFAGLGFDTPQKASVWLTLSVPTTDVGLIVDPHTVFKHIYGEENGDDLCSC
jgi:hypothetical protein